MEKKRGRPKKSHDGHLVGAHPTALAEFNRRRSRGEKHRDAITEAVRKVNKKYPEFPFRERDMRKLLASAQPSDFPYRYVATETFSDPAQSPEVKAELERLGLDPTRKWRTTTLSIAPAIKYTRHNAKGPKKKRVY